MDRLCRFLSNPLDRATHARGPANDPLGFTSTDYQSSDPAHPSIPSCQWSFSQSWVAPDIPWPLHTHSQFAPALADLTSISSNMFYCTPKTPDKLSTLLPHPHKSVRGQFVAG